MVPFKGPSFIFGGGLGVGSTLTRRNGKGSWKPKEVDLSLPYPAKEHVWKKNRIKISTVYIDFYIGITVSGGFHYVYFLPCLGKITSLSDVYP